VPLEFPLHCRCGHVRGVAREVAPSAGFRFVCYCRDCQDFARLLQRPDVLDAAGGTDIFQVPSGRVAIAAGKDALRCLSFSGKVLRWYTDCCRTPVANTAAIPGFPVAALIHSFMSHDVDGRSREQMLGPPACRIYDRSAVGPIPLGAPPRPSLAVFARRASRIFGWWWRGLGQPTPFFDDVTKAPIATPRLLAPSERAAL
jgi:hypothetical protein